MQSYFQLLNPLIFSLFAAAFLCISFVSTKARAALWLSASYALGAAAFTIDFFRNYMPIIVGSMASNLLYTATSSAVVIGLCQRYQRTAPVAPLILVGGLGFALYLYLYLAVDGLSARTIGINMVIGVIMSMAVVKIAAPAWSRPIDRVILVLVAAMAAQCFLRPLLLFTFDAEPTSIESYTQSIFFLTLHLVVGVIGISLAVALLIAFAMETIEDLARRSTTDLLSGVLNRRGFEEAAAAKLAAAEGASAPVAIILCDIDHFKAVNDSYGHAFGDHVIAQTGALLRGFSHGGRIAARLGGEEFALLLSGQRLDDARNIAEAIRRKFAATPFRIDGETVTFSASFGVALRAPGESLLDMLARADDALYLAKERGRNRVITEADVQVSDLSGALARLERRQFRRRSGESPATKAG